MGAGRGERENRDLLPAPPLLAAGAESLQKEDPPSRSQRKRSRAKLGCSLLTVVDTMKSQHSLRLRILTLFKVTCVWKNSTVALAFYPS